MYELTCKYGHKTITCLLGPTYRILLNVAFNAMVDGYHHEAVAASTAAMERFFEHFVRIYLRHNGIPSAETEATWDIASRQSERQLGMYLAIYLLHFKRPPRLLSSKQVEFRNKVIHRGMIPTREEALRHMDAVLDTIIGPYHLMHRQFTDAITQADLEEQRSFHKYQKGQFDSSVGEGWNLGLECTDDVFVRRSTSEEVIEEIASYRTW